MYHKRIIMIVASAIMAVLLYPMPAAKADDTTGWSPLFKEYRPSICGPITYSIHNKGYYKASAKDIRFAAESVGNAMGVSFVQLPANTDADIDIVWTTHATTPLLKRYYGGIVSYDWEWHDTAWVPVNRVVYLNLESEKPKQSRGYWRHYGRPEAKHIALHEIAHAVGLDHSPDSESMMYYIANNRLAWTSADLAGLAEMGRSTCHPGAH